MGKRSELIFMLSIYETPFIFWYCVILAFILGACIGSFVMCQAYRMLDNEPWWKGRSHCDSCGHELGVMDLFPIVSYVFLKGRCRYCHARIPVTSTLVELGMGIVYAGYLMIHGTIDIQLVSVYGLFLVLLGLSVVDLKSYEIPDGYILFGIVCWLINCIGNTQSFFDGLLGGCVIAGSILVLVLIMDKVLKKETMGGGDIKLFFLVSLFLGPFAGLLNVMISCVIGLVFVVALKQNKIPFGPSISLSAVICLCIGNSVVQWYMGLLGM